MIGERGCEADGIGATGAVGARGGSATDKPGVDSASPKQYEPLRIESLTVKPGRVVCEVAVDPLQRYTDAAWVSVLLEEHPTLPSHACVNEVGEEFGAVIGRTPVPHLLEHMVIDLQARFGGRPDDTFVGTTEWVDERAGRAVVQVSFTDDLVCLRAFRDATEKINAAMKSVNGKGTA